MPRPLELVLAWFAFMTVLTAGAFWWDRRAARRRAWRIRERTLWLLVLAGGVAGGWFGMLGLRHKTRHRAFWVAQWAASLLWVAVVVRAASGWT